MKELNLLTEWADQVIEGFPHRGIGDPMRKLGKFPDSVPDPVSEAGEKPPTRMGTQMKGKADRPLPRNVDIQYKAQRAHPELSPEQALALYMSDQLVDKEHMDLAQNKLINRVKRENEKLTRTVKELGAELHDFEQHSSITDKEVTRLKDLSAKLKPAGELQKQAVKASHDEVQKMLSDLELLKTKPGIDANKYQELKNEIEKVKTSPSSPEHVAQLSAMLNSMSNKSEINQEYFSQVTKRLKDIESHEANLRGDLESKLSSKEARFKEYVATTNKGMKDYEKKFIDFQDKLDGLEDRADDLLINVTHATTALEKQMNQISSMVPTAAPINKQPKPTKQQLVKQPASPRSAVLKPQTDVPQYRLHDLAKKFAGKNSQSVDSDEENITESILSEFETSLTKLSNGF